MLLDFKFKVDKNNKPSEITFEGLIRAQLDGGIVRYWEFLEEGEWTDFQTAVQKIDAPRTHRPQSTTTQFIEDLRDFLDEHDVYINLIDCPHGGEPFMHIESKSNPLFRVTLEGKISKDTLQQVLNKYHTRYCPIEIMSKKTNIRYVDGDLLEDDAEAIVNAVNCVGVMGAGIAHQFKKKFPKNFLAYKKACDEGKVVPGVMHVFRFNEMLDDRYIINFPTKDHWKELSKIEYINNGLIDLKRFVLENNIKSIAIPPLGCGLGGLDWEVVKLKIEQTFEDINVDVRVYQPL